MRWLLRPYPRAWRDRYGEEFLALLERQPATFRVVLDVLAGALDARLHPQVRPAPAPAHGAWADGFTEPARRILDLAQEEARRLDHHYIGTEHLLLALAGQPDCPGARVLASFGVDVDTLRSRVEAIVGAGGAACDRTGLALTPRAKRAIERAAREATRLRDERVGDEHLLLGLLGEGEGVAGAVLQSLGMRDAGQVRARLRELRQPPAERS